MLISEFPNNPILFPTKAADAIWRKVEVKYRQKNMHPVQNYEWKNELDSSLHALDSVWFSVIWQ